MDIRLKIISILEPRSFVKKNGEQGCVYSAVGETLDQYPKKVKFDVFYDERWSQMNLMVGSVYDLQIEVNSRCWNDKWFTSVSAQSAKQVVEQPQVETQPKDITPEPQILLTPQAPAATQPKWNTNTNSSSDDLPF